MTHLRFREKVLGSALLVALLGPCVPGGSPWDAGDKGLGLNAKGIGCGWHVPHDPYPEGFYVYPGPPDG